MITDATSAVNGSNVFHGLLNCGNRYTQPYSRRSTRQKIPTHYAVPLPCGSSRDTRFIPDPAVRSNPKTTVINDHSSTSGLSCARTRPLFAFWISCKFRTGSSLGVASGLWRILTVVSHHSSETLLGKTQTNGRHTLTPSTASNGQIFG